MQVFHPDDSGMMMREKGKDKNNGGGNNRMPAFQPGQLGALASQLNAGFGGGVKDWKADLRNTYAQTPTREFNFGGGNGRGNGGGKPDTRNPGGDPNRPDDGGFVPVRPRNMGMPMQAPQMGLLSTGPMPMQPVQPQPQNRGMINDIPPEVLAFLSSNMRR